MDPADDTDRAEQAGGTDHAESAEPADRADRVDSAGQAGRPDPADPGGEADLVAADPWTRLMSLLEPLHDQAAATARRLSRSAADGDDLFQEAVVRAYHKISSLHDDANFRSWFFALLLNAHRNRSQRGFWRRFLSLERDLPPGFDPPGEDGGGWEQKRRQVERASRVLAGLPAVQREAVVLFEIEGFSVEEIAAMQEVTVSAVKSRLARGRDRLRRAYQRLGLAPSPRQTTFGNLEGVL
jgi:RNA polymerase sigma-70 factor, ECF subfamily